MPYKCEKQHIPPELDRRRKFSDEAIENMIAMYRDGYSLRAIAREFNTHHKLVARYVIPGRKESITEKIRQRKPWLDYYDKDKNTAAIRKHRQYKRQLELAGKLNPAE